MFVFFQGPPTDAPAVDTAEQVYISSLALLKVILGYTHIRKHTWVCVDFFKYSLIKFLESTLLIFLIEIKRNLKKNNS